MLNFQLLNMISNVLSMFLIHSVTHHTILSYCYLHSSLRPLFRAPPFIIFFIYHLSLTSVHRQFLLNVSHFISIFFNLICSCLAVLSKNRVKRFLNADIHQRLSVLEQSHSTNREQTNNIFIRSAVAIGIVIIILLVIIFFVYRHLR